MRIALITQHYSPLKTSCSVQMADLAKELLKMGHEPIVVTPTDAANTAYQGEMHEGIRVFRLATLKTMDVGRIRRGFGEILLPFLMLREMRKCAFPSRELDAVVWYSPTIFLGPVVHFLKRSSNCSAYLILRDIFPEWMLDLKILRKGPAYYFFKFVARYQYSLANVVGMQTLSNIKYSDDWPKVANRRVEVLNNWLSEPDFEQFTSILDGSNIQGRKIFVYIGNMGVAQQASVFIDLAASLADRSDLGFLFVGRGDEVDNLKDLVDKKNMDNVIFHDEIDPSEIPALLNMCHVGLIALDLNHRTHNIPGKFLSYIRSGLPVLARINEGTDLGFLIQHENVGKVYSGSDISILRVAAESLVDNHKQLTKMSNRGRLLYQSSFSSVRAAKQIVTSIKGFG